MAKRPQANRSAFGKSSRTSKAAQNPLQQLKGHMQLLTKSAQEKNRALQQISEHWWIAIKSRLEQYEEELKKLGTQEDEAKKQEIESLSKKIMEIKARQKVLFRMREEHEGFSSGVKGFCKKLKIEKSLLSKIASLL